MTTVRLDTELERTLERLAKQRGQTKSAVVRDAIVRLAAESSDDDQISALDRLRPFIGMVDSGGQQLSKDTGRKFRELLERRRARHPH